MKKVILFGFLSLILSINLSNAQESWQFYENTNFERYKAANEKLSPLSADETRVVFMGNSITDGWPVVRPHFFEDSNYIGRGISGQTTPQMLLRFRKDVLDLSPKVVVILAGINDIAKNTGFTPIEMIAENIMSMAELAMYHNIEVVICSVLPAIDFPWSSGFKPANNVIKLNSILKKYAKENNLNYVDYHAALKDEQNGLKVPEYTTADDLVHPNEAGYIVMEKLVQSAIDQAITASTLSVPPFFTDHMVLQQMEDVAIWGNAPPNSQVIVNGSWGDSATGMSDRNGKWKLKLQTPKAGGPYQLNILSSDLDIQIKDVMIGEVWLASGQSNMAMPLKGWPPNDPINNSEEEIANAQYPAIRVFTVANKFSLKEEDSFEGEWSVCNPLNASEFSATAYFFAKRMHEELNTPIGIIHTSWGGTTAEAWTSKKRIKELGDFDVILKALEDPKRMENTKKWFGNFEKIAVPIEIEDWNHVELNDQHIAQPDYIPVGSWSTMQLPGRMDLYKGKDIDGVFWFRKTIELEDISSEYTFEMGITDDTDVVYFNGEKIGATAFDFANSRKYPIPMSVLKKGSNTIAIRIIDTGGPGSINNELKLTNGNNKEILLNGKWNYLISAEVYRKEIYKYDLEKVILVERPNICTASPFLPSSLYNAMIHPLLPYKIKGAIWYQGESNVGRAEQYKRLFPMMIKDWREKWNDDFPFYFVQIAPYQYNSSGEHKFDQSQKLRDAQRRALLLKKTGMVVTLDIGNNKNIHPSNKQDVGQRLAGLALANDYGKSIVASGPLYKGHTLKRKSILIEFDHIGSGLMAKDTELFGFEIAGSDKIFVLADAEIKGDKVNVCAKGISKPQYVRYAYRDTSEASLFNKEGLPASSFITEE